MLNFIRIIFISIKSNSSIDNLKELIEWIKIKFHIYQVTNLNFQCLKKMFGSIENIALKTKWLVDLTCSIENQFGNLSIK